MPQGIDPDSVAFLIADIARLMRAEFERRIEAEQLGITPAEARVLVHLARASELRQNQLADRLSIAPMSLTGFLDRLEAAGLIERRPDPQDRRAKRVRLAPGAAPCLADIGRIVAEIRAFARADIAPEDWERFQALAARIRDRLARGDSEA